MTKPKKDKKDLGIGRPVDPEWLRIEGVIRRDVEWAMQAGKGRFIVACWAVLPASKCDPKVLPPDVELPRDNDRAQIVPRINAFWPYSDMPVALRQFKEHLSDLIRQKHIQDQKRLEAVVANAPAEQVDEKPALTLTVPSEEVEEDKPEDEAPSKSNGQDVKGGPSDEQGRSVPAE